MLTYKRLRDAVHYNYETGVFIRLSSKRGDRIGKIAGCLNSNGYREIRIDCILYKAHRLAYFYMTEKWPYVQIDHINMNKGDNRWCNIRIANDTQNNANRRIRRDNTSGFKGVSLRKSTNRWHAYICVNKTLMHLGFHDTPEEAHSAYTAAAEKYFGEFARSK